MTKMNPEVKVKWLSALRSGEYTQGRAALRRMNKKTGREEFCCLGVLCDIAEKEGIVASLLVDDYYSYGAWAASGSLPSEVMEWAGLPSNPSANDPEYDTALTYMNDIYAFPFETIALIIEKEF